MLAFIFDTLRALTIPLVTSTSFKGEKKQAIGNSTRNMGKRLQNVLKWERKFRTKRKKKKTEIAVSILPY